MTDPNTYVLSKPIVSIDRTITSVTLREPTGQDLIAAGDPDQKMAYAQRLAEILGGLVSGTLATMAARDVVALMRIASGFLDTAGPAPSSTDTGTPPASGATPASSSA